MTPRISIVTPCLNRVGMIREALDSVSAQGVPGIEHIVVDGGSTDGTLDVVRRNGGVTLIEGPDRGLYDAIDKGIAASHADVVGILNSDDLLEPDCLAAVIGAFERDSALDIVSGGFSLFEESDGNLRERLGGMREGAPLDLPAALSVNPAINARFFRRRIFEECGPFDLRYPIAADRKFLIAAALAGFRNATLARPVYRYRWHVGSLTMNAGSRGTRQASAESLEIAREFLDDPSLGAGERRLIADYHTRLSVHEAIVEIYERNFRGFVSFARRGLRVDAKWPIPFSLALWKAGLGRLRR